MCRWLAYQGKKRYLDELLYKPEHSLIIQSQLASKAPTPVNADGVGIAWFEKKSTPALYHETLPAWSDPNLKSLSEHVATHHFMAHVRASTAAGTSRRNCHPFNVGKWLFMHNGQIPEFEKVRFVLERQLVEKYYLARLGATDSELIFMLLLQFDLSDSPYLALKKTITLIENELKKKEITEPFKASLCISNGQAFWALRYASNNQDSPTMFFKNIDEGIVLSSEPYDNSRATWHLVPAQSYLKIENTQINITPFN